MSQKPHWERVYASRRPDEVGWYAPRLTTSLAWIDALALPRQAHIIDVGGGASTLVDDLLSRGFEKVTVLDIAAGAISASRARLGERAGRVTWIEADITQRALPADRFSLWHDRAVFHFLVTPQQRASYVSRLNAAVQPAGHLIIGTFAPDAPPRCSGLPVERYTAPALQEVLEPSWRLEKSQRELHVTPGGVEQMYLYCQFRRA